MGDKRSELRERHLGFGVALGTAFGVAVGAGFGVAIGSLASGIGVGVALGVAMGLILGNKQAKAAESPRDEDAGRTARR